MKQEDLDLNKERLEAVRSQLKEFDEALREVATEVPGLELQQKVAEYAATIQLLRDKLCGVENFLGLLQPQA